MTYILEYFKHHTNENIIIFIINLYICLYITGCTQCSILLHLIDICFLTCICQWQISQTQTCLRVVVGPGLVSTSPAFYEEHCQPSSGSAWPACPKNDNWEGSTQFAEGLPDRCDSSTACRLCHLEPRSYYLKIHR